MVYKYKRKTEQAQWTKEVMAKALEEVGEGNSVNNIAKKYGLPRTTLRRHIVSGKISPALGRHRPVFSELRELELVAYLKEMDEVFFGLTKEDFKSLAYEFADKNSLAYPLSWGIHKKAGEDWLAGFLRRNLDISLRTPEPTSIARARGFNRPQVQRFYQNLSDQVTKHNIDASRLYNMDETGVTTTSNRPPKVLSVKGKKQVGVISSVERGQLTTVICCCNAAGSFISPFMIFARKRMQPRLIDGSPPGTQAACSPSGWINGEIFLRWLEFFVEQVHPSSDKKVILILDTSIVKLLEMKTTLLLLLQVVKIQLPLKSLKKLEIIHNNMSSTLKSTFLQPLILQVL